MQGLVSGTLPTNGREKSVEGARRVDSTLPTCQSVLSKHYDSDD